MVCAVLQAVRGTETEFRRVPGTLRIVFGDPPEWQEHIHVGFKGSHLKDLLSVVFPVLQE
jgi:hypothetical protein